MIERTSPHSDCEPANAWSNGPIGIAGAGRIACAIGRLLKERGEPVAAVASRTPAHAAEAAKFIGGATAVEYRELPRFAGRVLIAVADDALTTIAETLAEGGMTTGAVLHTCGVRGPDALAALCSRGVSCGALHPLQTVATPGQGVRDLPGCFFGFTGEGAAAVWAGRIVASLGGTLIPVSAAKRSLYHAAAVLAGNYVIGLMDAAAQLMMEAGADRAIALRALEPLARASIENAVRMGPEKALTGPVARGDLETVSLHSDAVAAASPTVRDLYRYGGLHLVELARRRGMADGQTAELKRILMKGQANDCG